MESQKGAEDFEKPTRTLLVPGPKEIGTEGVQAIWKGMMPTDVRKYTADAIKGTKVAPKKGAAIGAGNTTVLQQAWAGGAWRGTMARYLLRICVS